MTKPRYTFIVVSLLLATMVAAFPARAQDSGAKPLASAEIEQLVAPIALYPDDLLSHILMASTYPLEVVEAAR